MQISDFLNRTLTIKSRPRRIISLVPSQTELLVGLGLEEELLGITKFCAYPKRLKTTKKVVGGTKQVHLDKIKAIQPDIILCNKEENTADMVKDLEQIAPVHVSDIKTLEDNYKLIRDYAKIFQKQDIGLKMINDIKRNHDDFQKHRQGKPKLRVAYLIWRDPWMTVGGDTFIHHMLEINNFKNVFAHLDRYPEIDIQNLPDIDLLLLSSEPYPFKNKHLEEIPLPKEKVRFVNGEYFSWYGSRMLKAFDYFRHTFG
jgi:ABC-type Fe3+-hydroxamate transport system substrate-binding protein